LWTLQLLTGVAYKDKNSAHVQSFYLYKLHQSKVVKSTKYKVITKLTEGRLYNLVHTFNFMDFMTFDSYVYNFHQNNL